MLYSLSDGMKRVDVPENHKKNNLPIGTKLKLNGYSDPEYVIVKNLGISEKFPAYGARYMIVKLEDYSLSQTDAFLMKHIDDKKDNRIQMYYTDEILPPDEVMNAWAKSQEKERRLQEAKELSARIIAEKEKRGRELFAKYIPESAKALIVAELEIDNCDLQTDYFATSTSKTVVLGWSNHTRDIFSEMRKHAHKIPETEHLAVKPAVDCNSELKTEQNKSWWHPADEHREKWSMGHGYYLKAENRYSSGWRICKHRKYRGQWSSGLYIAMAERCIFE